MEFYEISTCDTEGNGEILWSSEGLEIVEPATQGFRAVHKLCLTCDHSFSNEAALRALKKIVGIISPEILELRGFEELDVVESMSGGFTKRALAVILMNAAKRWRNIHTLSLVDSNFLGSYDRDSMCLLFGCLPVRVRTLKVRGSVSLMIDRFDPASDDNGLHVPLNFDVIDMSGMLLDYVEEMSALTESFLARCMLRQGRHAERTTRPKIIYPMALATMDMDDLRDAEDMVLMSHLGCYVHARDVPRVDGVMVSSVSGTTNGPPTVCQSAVAFATKNYLLQSAAVATVYRAGFVQLFERIFATDVTRATTLTTDELKILALFYARILASTDEHVVDAMRVEMTMLLPLNNTSSVVRNYMHRIGLTSDEAIEQILPAWTDETTARWELIVAALSTNNFRASLASIFSADAHQSAFAGGAPSPSQKLMLWITDPFSIDIVNAPQHIAQIRTDVQAYCDWYRTQRAVSAVLSATQRALDTPLGAGAGAGNTVPRVEAVKTVGVVSVVQQWMCV